MNVETREMYSKVALQEEIKHSNRTSTVEIMDAMARDSREILRIVQEQGLVWEKYKMK